MCQIAGDELLLSIPNLARFLIKDGCEISFQLEPEGDAADISVFLVGTVFGALLHQRERIVLHASAVRVNGKAVVFCGSSGAGKSTLAAALSQRNYPLITDDLCAITLKDNENPLVHSDGRLLKLWAQAIEKLELREKRGDRVEKRLDKFYVQPGQAYMHAVPLGTIYVLREVQSHSGAVIEAPNVVDRTVLLRSNAYRPLFVGQMEQRVNYFRAATIIAQKVGIFYLTRALDFTAMSGVISALERHWQDIGLKQSV
jgi:ABC-type polar amino acid transport system ATPase subunit